MKKLTRFLLPCPRCYRNTLLRRGFRWRSSRFGKIRRKRSAATACFSCCVWPETGRGRYTSFSYAPGWRPIIPGGPAVPGAGSLRNVPPHRFQGEQRPGFLLPQPVWVESLLAALACHDDTGEVDKHRNTALEAITDTGGQWNGGAFDWASDSDSALARYLSWSPAACISGCRFRKYARWNRRNRRA